MIDQFLDSCRALTYPNYEIIVIENASVSAFDTVIDLREYPWLWLIRTERNMGFTGSNNAGIAEEQGNYFLLSATNQTQPDAHWGVTAPLGGQRPNWRYPKFGRWPPSSRGQSAFGAE